MDWTIRRLVNAETAVACGQERKRSADRMALPGLADLSISEPLKRKAVPSAKGSPVEAQTSLSPSYVTSDVQPATNAESQLPVNDFRRPSWPASSNRAPTITSLARPVFPPVHPVTNRPPSKSTSLPIPGPKPRTPSAGLLQRMPSFEVSRTPPPLARTVTPRRLNMKKASVDDLRRLYEERAGTVKTLVEAGRRT
ncbi:hypothetical protein P154DRAFT_518971 [Amniculicola lignicola CBS 123094]|uniref:Uncharacterized protein n=1 Tax=Amniculicola lignicola CBS 123094 TaxID=1392246 RepID=A0A6A5WTK6_9PLEO|nr:hypothetical protein P154DRAFT_518971 [Amniculicola lignicola CBS 123094]